MEKLKVLSLFCGCGGMDLGLIGGFNFLGQEYAENCFELVKAIDNDEFCTQIYNANFKHKCEVMDVRDIKIAGLPDIDMLIGGFPCQSFSISAQNPPRLGYKDERGMLFFEMVKILKAKQPRFFIAENVKGLLSANNHKAFPMIIREFENAGYKVRYQLLNSYNYGVPQKRERVIIVGFRETEDYKRFQYPMSIRHKKVLRDVLDEGENQNERLFFSEKAVAGMMAVRDKMNKGRVQSLNEPCNTISAHLAKVSLNSTDPVFMVGERYRRFSCRECARIQSFPETFRMDMVSDARQYKAIGNAVPPVLMWHIAKALQNCIEDKTKPIEREYLTYDEWFSKTAVQLTLFEPSSLYISKDKQRLIGTCRQGTRKWIADNLKYNYPIEANTLQTHPELTKVKRLIVKYRNTILGNYIVTGCAIVTKKELKQLDYPVKSSKHKADTKYILYTLETYVEDVPYIISDEYSCILGKGVLNKI